MERFGPKVNFQQHFACSDDVAATLANSAGLATRVDASIVGLGALMELLVLKRAPGRSLQVADRSNRGRLLSQLLPSREPFMSVGSTGFMHWRAGEARDQSGNDFAHLFYQRLMASGLEKGAALRLSGALNELLDNVDEHAGLRADGLGAFEVREREAWMVVADCGQGAFAGYQTSSVREKPVSAEDALKWAVIEHRSRTGDLARGTGFQTVIKSIRSLDGCLRVRSDKASIELEQQGGRPRFLLREQGELPGFVVTALLRWCL